MSKVSDQAVVTLAQACFSALAKLTPPLEGAGPTKLVLRPNGRFGTIGKSTIVYADELQDNMFKALGAALLAQGFEPDTAMNTEHSWGKAVGQGRLSCCCAS